MVFGVVYLDFLLEFRWMIESYMNLYLIAPNAVEVLGAWRVLEVIEHVEDLLRIQGCTYQLSLLDVDVIFAVVSICSPGLGRLELPRRKYRRLAQKSINRGDEWVMG